MSLNLLNKSRNKEFIEEDNDINRRVIASLKKQVEAFDESEKVKPMKQINFIDSSKFQNLLDKLTKDLQQSSSLTTLSIGNESSIENFEAFNDLVSYNNIVSIYKNPTSSLVFRQDILTKLQNLLPILNTILDNLSERIKNIINYIKQNISDQKKVLYSKLLLETLTYISLYDFIYNNIDMRQLDYANYNNLILNIKNNIKNFSEDNQKIVNDIYDKYAIKTKSNKFEPLLSKKEIDELKSNEPPENIDEKEEEEQIQEKKEFEEIIPKEVISKESKLKIPSNDELEQLDEVIELRKQQKLIEEAINEIESDIKQNEKVIDSQNKTITLLKGPLQRNPNKPNKIAFSDFGKTEKRKFITKLNQQYNFYFNKKSDVELEPINEKQNIKILKESINAVVEKLKENTIKLENDNKVNKNSLKRLEEDMKNFEKEIEDIKQQKKERELTPEEQEELKLAFEGKLSKKLKSREEKQPILEPQPEEEPKPEGKGRRNRFNMRFGGLQSLYDDNY